MLHAEAQKFSRDGIVAYTAAELFLNAGPKLMPLFDYYLMTDWSGGNSRKTGENSIWVAHGSREGAAAESVNPPSRSEAMSFLTEIVSARLREGCRRILACFDFAFGFPNGFTAHLPSQDTDPRWLNAWSHLTGALVDDIGTPPNRRPTNKSNRFDVANDLNTLIGTAEGLGPFWCADGNWATRLIAAGGAVVIPQNMPLGFVSCQQIPIPPFRHTDHAVSSNFPFRCFGNGSVGSQILTGIPRLHALRFNSPLSDACRVWPFETGWASDDGNWIGEETKLVIAEIYPSVLAPLEDGIADRGQVRAMWQWARDLDANDHLSARLSRPHGLTDEEALIALTEEGWVLH